MTPDTLLAALTAAADTRVLCIGDAILDRYVFGSIGRISPEAPVPVFAMTEQTDRTGGVGNVCRNLDALGVRADLVATRGTDSDGAVLDAQLGLCTRSVSLIERPLVPTTLKTRYIAKNQQVLRVDREEVCALTAIEETTLLARANQLLAGCNVLLLSDYAKGVLTPGVVTALISAARAADITVIVDPKSRDFGLYAGADLLTPNMAELEQAAGRKLSDQADVETACRELMAAHDIRAIAATRSEKGMLLVEASRAIPLVAMAHEVFDVTGAGDTVIAMIAACLSGGMALEDACYAAMVAAGIVVRRPGAAVVTGSEVARAIAGQDHLDRAGKIASIPELQDKIARWRQSGKTVGFANGCFDLLHPGHIGLLTQAAAECDQLIVAINSDASVARLKGPERPLQTSDVRGLVLSALDCVDAVVVFEEDTPFELITALQPDVLIKGSDYTVETVVGADVVQARGGRVALVDLVSGFSTTGTVEKIKALGAEI